MKAPRDLARAQSGARQFGRVAAPAVPALAGMAALRDLTDLEVWEDSIRRSRLRRDARERQLNIGPVTGKRLAVPMAMLAAGLLVRDAVTDDGSGSATGIAHAGPPPAPAASPTKHRATHAATHTRTQAPAKKAVAAPAKPAKRLRPAKTR